LYPALLKMPFRIRLFPQHISNQTDTHGTFNFEYEKWGIGLV